jgi:hypothetical protein
VDADGVVSPEDSRLATGRFTSGTATMEFSHPFYLATGFNQLLVTVDIPVWASPGATVQVSLSENGTTHSITGGNDLIQPFGMAEGNPQTIAPSNDALAGLVISEVFEGSQGNLKYLEFYNGTSNTINLATAGVTLRRYTNGNGIPLNIGLTAGSITAGELFVLANNSTDFQAAFGFLPDATDANISHNGNDCYDLFKSNSLVLDAFAADRIGSSADFAGDRVAHRLPESLPNSGNWGTPVSSNPPDGTLSPSGFWRERTVTTANGNAQQVGTPGELGEPVTSIDLWNLY